ncbi:glycosyltransferase [Flavobacterium gelidilacus]|jgi:glycosyltransferase involved in cell wall biosynthesis|uniref:glycosyltransferase n=1 Tax=Flavobacterium gelidilacus TaxID=206041 RepID=UPI0004124452|nr:glycosyltransferase [Flavobacterium gelidilacus]
MSQKKIVISGINVVDSGILSIMTDCLNQLEKYSTNKNIKIIALVNSQKLFSTPNIEYIEFPKSKKNWLFRLYYEYFHFKKLSKEFKADVWFSMHDLSPNVVSKNKYVYYHNPSPFYKLSNREWFFGFKIGLFSKFYKYLTQINIHSNDAVFVQQHWIKNQFEQWFSIKNCKVAYPETQVNIDKSKVELNPKKVHFFYPSFPRMFKNFECICDAILKLPIETQNKIEVHFTISGNENKYAKSIYKTYSKYECFKFVGKLNRNEVAGYYEAMNALLFPSKLETWGLPLTETKEFNKPIFVSDLPYAKETVGNYNKVSFFNPSNSDELAEKLKLFITNKLEFDETKNSKKPDFVGWNSIFDYIFEEDKSFQHIIHDS